MQVGGTRTIHRRTFGIAAALVLLYAVAMVLGARLLMVAGGGAAFTAPPPPEAEVVQLTSEDYGGWTLPNPAAYHDSGKTFFIGVHADDGSVWAAEYVHSTGLTSTPFTLASGLADEGSTDNHNQPSILVRDSDSRLLTAYAGHLDTRIRVRVSTNPLDATAWGSEQVLDPGYGGVYTYAQLTQLRGVTGGTVTYLFARSIPNLGSQVGRLIYATSTDHGATWSSFTVLFTGDTSPALVPYWSLVSDWDTRIDIFTSEGTGAKLYHWWGDGEAGTWHQSDGTPIGSLPLEVGDLTEVYDGTGATSAFALAATFDGTAPATLYARLVGADNEYWTARWRSGAWQHDEVASVVHHAANNFLPSGTMLPTDPDVLWLGQKVGARYEAFRYTSSDDGATWSGEQITTSSTRDQMWFKPVYFADDLEAIWLDITYVGDTNFDAKTVGYRN